MILAHSAHWFWFIWLILMINFASFESFSFLLMIHFGLSGSFRWPGSLNFAWVWYILTIDFSPFDSIWRVNKTTTTLFGSKMGLAIGACHDVGCLSYINDLYNQDRKDSTKFKLCERKSLVQLFCRKSYKSPLGKQKTKDLKARF